MVFRHCFSSFAALYSFNLDTFLILFATSFMCLNATITRYNPPSPMPSNLDGKNKLSYLYGFKWSPPDHTILHACPYGHGFVFVTPWQYNNNQPPQISIYNHTNAVKLLQQLTILPAWQQPITPWSYHPFLRLQIAIGYTLPIQPQQQPTSHFRSTDFNLKPLKSRKKPWRHRTILSA